MIDIPINAQVECKDGKCGESVAVVVNPTTQQVTHFAVRVKSIPDPAERLVPVDLVVETKPNLIRLRCNRDELAELEPFLETHYIETVQPEMYPVYLAYEYPYVTPMEISQIPIEVERVPPGELAVHRGTMVEASDGYVGRVGELLVDPSSGHITHLVLQEGHAWGKKEITLPLSAIDFVREDTVHLKLDKKAIEQLPAIPVKRSYARGTADIELVAMIFDKVDQASEALEYVQGLHQRQILKILNAAILAKDQDGNTTLKDTRDIDAKKGRLLGAIAGGLIGLLAGPGGAILGALAGAGAGGLAGKWIDMGFSNEFLAGLQDRLQPGSAALIVLVETEWAVKVSEALADREGMILQQPLTDRLVKELIEASEEG